MPRNSVDNCRRRLRKRAHFRSLCFMCSIIFGIGFLIFTLTAAPNRLSSHEEKEYNLLLDKLKVKGRGKTSFLYVDKSEYTIADEQPDTSDIRNILAKRPFIVKTNDSLSSERKNGKNTTAGADRYYGVNHDASIEENAIPESYKWHINLPRSTSCTKANPAKHAVLLRSHRTGSHTVSNIFYRYGDFNDLFFALPKGRDFQQYWPLRFHHTRVDKTLLGKDAPNFLVNTARNSRINIKSFLSSETYKIGIMRDPVEHFESIYESIDMPFLMSHVKGLNRSDHFKVFVNDPKGTLEKITNVTNAFDPVFYLLHNGQMFDFGYNVDEYTNTIDIQFVVHELEEYIDLALITEHMDESLVLLQRMLCWELSDVVYLKQRARRNHATISEEDKKNIRKWNRHDTLLYNHFNDTLWEKIATQDQDSFWRDVDKLRKMNANIRNECVNDTAIGEEDAEKFHRNNENHPLPLTYTKLNASRDPKKEKTKPSRSDQQYEITHLLKDNINENVLHICERLLLTEEDYIEFLKQKQKGLLEKNAKEFTEKMYFRNTTSLSSQKQGKFYYEYMKSLVNVTTTMGDRTTTTIEPIIDGGGLHGGPPQTGDERQGEEEVGETTLIGLSHTDR